MAQQRADPKTATDKLPHLLLTILAVAIAALVVEVVVYRVHFGPELSTKEATWADFGSFLGGTLGPVYALLALLAVLLTLHMQNRAFKEQERALAVQRFENTFFEMVRLHHSLVSALDLRKDGKVTTAGRDCFRVFYNRFGEQHSQVNASLQGEPQLVIAQRAYSQFHAGHQDEIAHYFRNFYRILKFIDESDMRDKDNYTGILRAQLSSPELALMFYNALSPMGAKLRPLIERYQILENLDVPNRLRNARDEIGLIGRSAFGDQDLAQYDVSKPA